MTVCVCTGTVTFIGSHLDVVPANPETWDRPPFKLKVEVYYACDSDDPTIIVLSFAGIAGRLTMVELL